MIGARERNLLFLMVCIPLRLLLVYLAWRWAPGYSVVAAVIASAAVAGFVVSDARGGWTGAFGGERVWSGWAHAVFFACFAVVTALGFSGWPFLLGDVVYALATNGWYLLG